MFPFDTLLHIIGLLFAFIIGLSLGLLGSGGSAITVPVLVYCMGLTPSQAIPDSVFIVGVTSGAGAVFHLIKGKVAFGPLVMLGLPSVATAWITRVFLVPRFPQQIIVSDKWILGRDSYLMIVFAFLLVVIAVSMIKGRKEPAIRNTGYKIIPAIATGILTGFLIGALGVGGGFIIVPVLVIFFRLPMHKAVGTSLWLIALNSLVSFSADIDHSVYSWQLLLFFAAIALAGMFISWTIAPRLPSHQLRRIAGWVILVTGIFVIAERLIN